MTAELDKDFLQAIMQSVMNASPEELLKMMDGARFDFTSSFDDVPLDIAIKIKENVILARIKILEVKESDGDQPESG